MKTLSDVSHAILIKSTINYNNKQNRSKRLFSCFYKYIL